MINLSSASDPVLSFDYHMYGAATGSLDVLVDGASVWTLSGDQGNQWTSVNLSIDASTLSNASTVSVTFRGTTGADYRSDISIDNICFLDCPLAGTITGDVSACIPGTSQLSQDGGSVVHGPLITLILQ
jgi:hypothetical protein